MQISYGEEPPLPNFPPLCSPHKQPPRPPLLTTQLPWRKQVIGAVNIIGELQLELRAARQELGHLIHLKWCLLQDHNGILSVPRGLIHLWGETPVRSGEQRQKPPGASEFPTFGISFPAVSLPASLANGTVSPPRGEIINLNPSF